MTACHSSTTLQRILASYTFMSRAIFSVDTVSHLASSCFNLCILISSLTAGFVHQSTICLSDCGTFRTWTKTRCCYPLGGKRKFKRIWSLPKRNAEFWWSPRKHNSGKFKVKERIQLFITLNTLELHYTIMHLQGSRLRTQKEYKITFIASSN